MVTIHTAHTAPINPSSSSATPQTPLTHAQVWAGLQRKIRYPQEFVPVIASCSVLSDDNGVVTRDVVFKPGAGPSGKSGAREVVRGFGRSWVDFEQEDGSVIRNIISDGGEGEGAVYLTFAFEMRFPELQEGGKEAEEKREGLRRTSKMAVEKTIETIRQMVVDGRITE